MVSRSGLGSIVAELGVKGTAAFRMDRLLTFWLQHSPSLKEERVHIAKEMKIDGYYVDFCLEFQDKIILIEVDEKQHSSYDQITETTRMTLVLQAFRRKLKEKGKPNDAIYMIRFNPHPFIIDCQKFNTSPEIRDIWVIECLESLLRKDKHPEFSIIYAFYDMSDHVAWSHPEFSDLLLPFCSVLASKQRILSEDTTTSEIVDKTIRSPVKDVEQSTKKRLQKHSSPNRLL